MESRSSSYGTFQVALRTRRYYWASLLVFCLVVLVGVSLNGMRRGLIDGNTQVQVLGTAAASISNDRQGNPPPIIISPGSSMRIPSATIDSGGAHRGRILKRRAPTFLGSSNPRPVSLASVSSPDKRLTQMLKSKPKHTPGAKPPWALEMGRNLPLTEDAGSSKKVQVYIVNRSFKWLFMSLGDKLYNNLPDRSTVRQMAYIGQIWNIKDKKLRKLQGFEVWTMHHFTCEYGNQVVHIRPDGHPDKDVPAMPFLKTVLNSTGFKPVQHYIARPQWAKEMGRWIPPLKPPAANGLVHFYIVNHSPYRWWGTLGDKRYNSVPPRATARQVAYVGQQWSFTNRKKQTLMRFGIKVFESIKVTAANQAIYVPPSHLHFSSEPK